MRVDETMVPAPEGLANEFPDGVALWMIGLPAEEVRSAMALRREGYTMLGFDPAEDAPDKFDLH